MKLLIPLIPLLLLAACATSEPRYAGPPGQGRLIYSPEVGITRADADTNQTEQALFAIADEAFRQKRYDVAINATLQLSEQFPEGSRIVEALLIRVVSRLELGRNHDPDDGLPETLALDQWMFLYLAPLHDERLQGMLNRDAESREFINELRDTTVGDFVNKLSPDAIALYNSYQIDFALQDCLTLLNYYLPALELREFRRKTAELTRDVAWLLYAAEDFDGCIALTNDLLAMNPAPSIKGDAMFIQAQAQRRNGAHALSANTFALLFNGAGLRDTDTRWRPYALMWQIYETMASSKGPMYDVVPYERALELLGEYELYAIENPNIPTAVHDEFVKLVEDVYGVMVERDLNSADTYSRLGESRAESYYIARAAEWENARDERVATLRKEIPAATAPREN